MKSLVKLLLVCFIIVQVFGFNTFIDVPTVSAETLTVPQSQMTATTTSFRPGNEASNAIDGSSATHWHTEWYPMANLPQSITLSLGGTYNVSALKYLPRIDSSNGRITSYNIYVSSDGISFTQLATGNWADTTSEKTVSFTAASASYVNLEAIAGDGGFASAAEINVQYVSGATPTPTPTPTPGATGTVPHSQMTATATSQHSDFGASLVLDNNNTTFWHSDYSGAPLPQSITLSLGATYNVSKLRYQPRTDYPDANGIITSYKIYTSTDGSTFTQAASGLWANSLTEKSVTFTATNASYVKLEAIEGNGGYATAAEINVEYDTGTAPTPTPTPTATPTATPIPTPEPGESVKIIITKDMLVNESTSGDASLLFDENNTVGDTPTGTPVNSWRVEGGGCYWPSPSVIIDLGQTYEITDIYYYDGPKSGDNGFGYSEIDGGQFKVASGTPFHWTNNLTYTLENSSEWKSTTLSNCQTRYLQLAKEYTKEYMWSTYGPFKCDANITEVVIYGNMIGSPEPTPTPAPTPDFDIPLGSLIGTNAFEWDKVEDMTNVGFIREYHDWCKTDDQQYPNNLCSFWNDGWYQGLNANGATINLCLQSHTAVGDSSKPNDGPSTIPASYAGHADHMFQLAARFGSTVVPRSLLKVRDSNIASGLNLIKYYESWNEPNNWWAGDESHFSPYEYAAMASADYDGHCQTMGTTVGLKNADPNAKFVMGGFAGIGTDWIKSMIYWFNEYRADKKFVFDALNFHYYSTTGSIGLSPEEDNLKEKMEALVDFRNLYCPDSEVWISEFGWDTDQGSTQRAVAHSGFDGYEIQGQWLVRGYLGFSAAGIDRVNQFMLDNAGGGSGTYATCGFLDDNGNKKPSWYYVSTMKNRLNTMKYIGEQATENSNVWAYKFKESTNSNGAYAVWCPTKDGTAVNNYQLSLPTGTNSAKLVTLTNGNANGVETNLTITNNQVTINVSERPVFIMINNMQ